MAFQPQVLKISGQSGAWWFNGTDPLMYLSAGSGVGQDLQDLGAALTYVTSTFWGELDSVFGHVGGP